MGRLVRYIANDVLLELTAPGGGTAHQAAATPSRRIALVFAGQGAQAPGMGRDLYENSPAARAVFDQADTTMPGIKALCFDGPKDQLNVTINTQPALFVTDLACAAALGEAGVTVDGAAGFSLGEVAAAAFTGLLPSDEAYSFVQQRAKAMQEAGENQPGTMLAVMNLGADKVEAAAEAVGDAWPVNYNCPGQIVVACATSSAPALSDAVAEAGGKAMRLPVSGAFHSPLMDPAASALTTVLDDMTFCDPAVPLYANLTGHIYGDPAALLGGQVNHPVRWQQCIETMIGDGFDTFVEVGPGKTLTGFIKRINPEVTTLNVRDTTTLNQTMEMLGA
jgi:[acyl-carrier-protein] S-malonyltransferase